VTSTAESQQGARKMEQEKEPGLDLERVRAAVRLIGGQDDRPFKWKDADPVVGELLGVTPRAVESWRSGDRQPSHADTERLARALGVSIEWLYGYGESDEPQQRRRGGIRLVAPP
jgi:hypothetical protein